MTTKEIEKELKKAALKIENRQFQYGTVDAEGGVLWLRDPGEPETYEEEGFDCYESADVECVIVVNDFQRTRKPIKFKIR